MKTTKYKVRLFQDNIYEVVEISYYTEADNDNDDEISYVFQGSLTDCNTFIQLKEKGQI